MVTLGRGLIDFLLHCFHYLRPPQISLLFGLGGLSPEMSILVNSDIEKYGLQNRFRIFPFTDSPELWFKAADLFYLTSREDPFPSVVLEALAAGLPLLGIANTTGSNKLIKKHGVLIDTPSAAIACKKNNYPVTQ